MFQDTEPMEDSRCVGCYLNTSTYLCDFSRLLQNRNFMARSAKPKPNGESGDTGAYDNHVEPGYSLAIGKGERVVQGFHSAVITAMHNAKMSKRVLYTFKTTLSKQIVQ